MAKQVLIVDDEETLTWSLSKTLARDRETYEVTTVNDGLSAAELLQQKTFDVVVLDIRVPGINGLDLLVKIKQEQPATKVIIMTAYGSSEIREKAKARGSLYYIEKPFELDEMRSLILKSLREDSDKGFKGSMSGLQLPDLIQMNCLSQITTALYVKKDNLEGVIYFDDGQITHAQVGALEGEEALFNILAWQSGIFQFEGGQKAPTISISTNWEYLLIEGMRMADEMSLALEKGEVDDHDVAPIDEATRMMVKNISALTDFKSLVVMSHTGDTIYQSGSFSKEISIPFVTKFFMNIADYMGDLVTSSPQKISFMDQGRLVLVYPYRIHILVIQFSRAVLSPDAMATIERVITGYQA